VPRRGDIVLTREAPLGDVGKIRTDDAVFLGQRLYHFRPDPTKLDTDFLLYSLLGDDLQSQIRGFGSGSTVEHMRLEDIPSLEFNVPPLPTQRRIAGILSAFDELIENSQRRIKILETMARALYREALGTGNETATSRPIADSPFWRFISENVSNYAETKRYYATADIEGLAVTGAGIDYSFADKPSRAQKQPVPNSVWFARMKETYKIAWYGPQDDDRVSGAVLSSGFAGFEARDAELWPLLFLTVSSKEFHVQKDLYCTGATQMSLTNEGMARIMVPIPDEQSARRLGRVAGPMLNAIAGLQRRNENLRRTRDLLLPRLLSGQIDVEAMPA
jgi:type I restriction enzyme S subunit